MEVSEKRERRRGLYEVLSNTLGDIISWLLPFLVMDGIAQCMRTLLMEATDSRGPWECLWHKVSNTLSIFYKRRCEFLPRPVSYIFQHFP